MVDHYLKFEKPTEILYSFEACPNQKFQKSSFGQPWTNCFPLLDLLKILRWFCFLATKNKHPKISKNKVCIMQACYMTITYDHDPHWLLMARMKSNCDDFVDVSFGLKTPASSCTVVFADGLQFWPQRSDLTSPTHDQKKSRVLAHFGSWQTSTP